MSATTESSQTTTDAISRIPRSDRRARNGRRLNLPGNRVYLSKGNAGVQLVNLLILGIPATCVSWTVTHEEVFRELRERLLDAANIPPTHCR